MWCTILEVEQKQVVKKSRLDVNKTVDRVSYNSPGSQNADYWKTKSPVPQFNLKLPL